MKNTKFVHLQDKELEGVSGGAAAFLVRLDKDGNEVQIGPANGAIMLRVAQNRGISNEDDTHLGNSDNSPYLSGSF